MAESALLEIQKREGRGSRQAQRLRKQGLVPAVVYGHKQETLAITLSGDAITKAVRHGSRVVDLQSGATREKALIRELQWDHLGKEILHVDFERVSEDERIEVPVRLELRGVAPGIAAGGVLDQPMHNLLVECLAISIPDSIRVNINELQVGSAIHVRDLVLPEGVKALDDPEAIVVHVTQRGEEKVEAAPVEGAAEPEVIGRKAAEEEGAEE